MTESDARWVLVPRGCVAAAVAAVVLSAGDVSAGIQVGEGEVVLVGDASLAWDSNLEANNEERAGWVASTSGVASWSRRGGNVGVSAAVGFSAVTFSEDLGQDGVRPQASASLAWEAGRFDGGVSASYGSESRLDEGLGRRLVVTSWSGSADVRYDLGPRFGLGAGVSASRSSPEGEGVGDRTDAAASARVIYHWLRNVDVFAGYEHVFEEGRGVGLGGGDVDSRAGSFIVGTEGELPVRVHPRLNLKLRAGWQARTGRGAGREKAGGLVADTTAGWQLSPLTTLSVGLARDVTTDLDGASSTTTRAGVGVEHRFTDRARVSGGVSWAVSERGASAEEAASDQDRWGAEMTAVYSLTRLASFRASVAVTTSDSAAERRDYLRQVVTLGARIEY